MMYLGLHTHDSPHHEPVGKYFFPMPDGTLAKRTVGILLRNAYQTAGWATLADLAAWMETASPVQHLTQGISKHSQATVYSEGGASGFGDVCPTSSLPIIMRNNECLPFRQGEGVMVIDSDSAGQEISFNLVRQGLCTAEPALASYAAIQTTSSGSCVKLGNTDTGVRGIHTFFQVADATDIPRAMTVLHQRMMLRGFARHKLSVTGGFLARSLVDQALRTPSQPIYLRAHLTPPAEQHKQMLVREGAEVLDTRAVIPDLTREEQVALQEHLRAEQVRLKLDMEQQAEAYLTTRSKALAEEQGITEGVAFDAVKAAMGQRLLHPDFVIHVGTERITVAEILADPARWNGRPCCDPLDPDYDNARSVAKIYVNADGNSGRIQSFAHSAGDKGNVFHMWTMPPVPTIPTGDPPMLDQAAIERIAATMPRNPALPAGARPIRTTDDFMPVAATNWEDIPLPPIDGSVVANMGKKPDITNDTMAKELAALLFNDNARYWGERGRWLLWDGRKWVLNAKMRVFDVARVYLRAKAEQARSWSEEQATYCSSERQALTLLRWGQQAAQILRQAPTVAALHQMLLWTENLNVLAEALDSDPMLLGTPDGVVDLRTGSLRPARRADLITQHAAVSPAPEGTPAPIWEAFLLQVMGDDPEMVAFLQRAIGYALTGSVAEQKFLFLTGSGRNGKSVFLNTVLGMMGDYARKAPASLFIETKNQEHSTGVAGLRGVRFVFGSEIPSGSFWNETALKDMTGGDKLTARFMRGDYFDFDPQFLLAIAANSKPALRDTSQSTRIACYSFRSTSTFRRRSAIFTCLKSCRTSGPRSCAGRSTVACNGRRLG